MTKQMFQDKTMGIGKRIVSRLDELGWARKKLYDAIPKLSPQALSNLIVRDSTRSEWDEQIAKALGVSVLWLVYGKDVPYTQEQPPQKHGIGEPPQENIYLIDIPQINEVVKVMRNLPAGRQDEILRFAQERFALESVGDKNSTQRHSM